MKATLQKRLIKIGFGIALVLACSSTRAQIASWTYEPAQGSINNPAPNTGTGTSAIVNLGGGTITPNIRTGMTGSGCGAQVSGTNAWAFEPFDPGSTNQSNGAQFTAGTAGYKDIVFTWDQRWSNTSPNTLRIQYTTNGTVWNNFVMTATNTTFCLGSVTTSGCFETNATGDVYRRIRVDFTSITAANNNPNFGIRILAAHYQATGQFRQAAASGSVAGTAGTWRFDNVIFSGTPLLGPNPSVMSGTTSICAGGTANLKVTITGGAAPYTVIYNDGTSNATVTNYASATNIPVTPASTRTYTIVSVTDANGSAGTGNSGSAVITVNALPLVSAANVSTCVTGAFTLTAGIPAGGTYSIPNPYSGPTTTYTYTYTNASGCPKTSIAYTFTRNTPPVVATQPAISTQTVCQGEAFMPVSITATGSATLTYQWYSNTVQSTTGGTPLTTAAHIANGSKTASYTPLAAVVGTLYYYVTVTNSCTTVKSGNATGACTVVPGSVAGTVSASQLICAGTAPADLTISGNAGTIIKWQRADDAAFTLGVQDISVTATTLTGATIGNVLQTTWFRAFVQNGSCVEVATPAVEIQVKTTVWNGAWSDGVPNSSVTAVFTADYISTGDLAACSVIVNSGNVIFNPNHTLIIQNSLTVNGGSMTLENNAALIQVNNTVNSGNITYKRNTTPVTRYDYTYWSSPVSPQILADFSPLTMFDKYYWWNTTTYNWNSIVAPGLTLMDIGKGYIIRSPQPFNMTTPAIFEGVFEGVPNNGDYTVPIIVSSAANNLNLIGNPYPSALDADLFMSDPSNAAALGTGSTIYLWTHNTPITSYVYTTNDYATYNYTGGVGTAPSVGNNNNIPNGCIAAGQAFFINGLATGTATFSNTMRTAADNTQFFKGNTHKSAGMEKNRIWLELRNNQGAYKQMLVGYVENATNAFDRGFDGELVEAGNTVSLYSILDSKKMAIQGRALPFNSLEQIPLGYRAAMAGNFEINASDFDGLFNEQEIYLEDTLLHVIHNLKTGPYAFASPEGTFESRFVLRFTDSAFAIADPAGNETQVIVYKTTNGMVVNAGNAIIGELKIIDMSGRVLWENKKIAASEITIPIALPNSVFLIRAVLENGAVVTKKASN